MPKIRTCKYVVNGAEFTEDLRVDSKGVFSMTAPGIEEDHPLKLKITGNTADEVEKQWKAVVREYAQRTTTERKVIAVKFDSYLRTNGAKSAFDRDHMLYLECLVCLETVIQRGEEKTIKYTEHRDYSGLHKQQPFPWAFQCDVWKLNRDRSNIIFVDWSQEIENALLSACKGIQAIVDMLDQVLSTPEALKLHVARLAQFALPETTKPIEP